MIINSLFNLLLTSASPARNQHHQADDIEHAFGFAWTFIGSLPSIRFCLPSETDLLFDLVRNADKGEGSAVSPADSYMQLAVYDLLGALFAPPDPLVVSRHADRLFERIRHVIKDGFADPDFGPREVAAETGISLRYVQKLFTARGSAGSDGGSCVHA